MTDPDELRKTLENFGVAKVKEMVAAGSFGHSKERIIAAWLKEKDECVNKKMENQKISLKQEANELAKEALSESKIARYLSITSIIIAIIAAAISLFK